MDSARLTPRVTLNRRTLLAGSLATALAGAMPVQARATAAVTRATVSSLTSTHPFYIAHRGGGRNWPAMTAYAYSQAVQVPGIHALEISVGITSDGVLVCNHNPTTTHMTGVPYVIADETWETLSQLRVLPTYTLDPSQPSRPFSTFEEVSHSYIDNYVLFVEPKVSLAGDKLMKKMASFGQPQRIVWKQPINSRRFAVAKEHGFTTWGYVLNEPAHTGDNLERYAASPHLDMLGAPLGQPDAFVSQVVDAADRNGKKTIAWEVSSVAHRTRALRLGCTGLMTSDVVNVPSTPL